MCLVECEYCGEIFHSEVNNEEFCSKDCKRQEEQFRRAEESADHAFEEMAYGPMP